MASPNFDSLSVSLSHLIDDPVAAAATDGSTVTSAYRTIFLNDGVRNCLRNWVQRGDWMALRSYLLDGSATLENNSKTLSSWTGTPFIILSAKNSTDNVLINEAPQELKHVLDTGMYSNYFTASATNQFYVVTGGSFVLIDGGTTTGDTVYLRYVKEHTNLTVANSTDIEIDSQYWDELLQEAYKIYLRRYPTTKNMQALQINR